ncbi:uncharacterized protein LOC127286704 [Leptopilina boulardi]|uniref:uncharacterized protein LOC127286704 n=1 Tax=Leptopilina boulardi TaxID=63433 RepID=UPI0021F64B78|nr:uncharacterized protein LOC127286704 [Leptopilina boulardi]
MGLISGLVILLLAAVFVESMYQQQSSYPQSQRQPESWNNRQSYYHRSQSQPQSWNQQSYYHHQHQKQPSESWHGQRVNHQFEKQPAPWHKQWPFSLFFKMPSFFNPYTQQPPTSWNPTYYTTTTNPRNQNRPIVPLPTRAP